MNNMYVIISFSLWSVLLSPTGSAIGVSEKMKGGDNANLGQNYNHFEILETMANPYGLLGRAALEQMRLG